MGIRTDMGVDKKDLSVFDRPVTVPKVDLPFAEGFDLCSQKADSSFHGVFDRIMKPGLLVLADQLFAHDIIF
jgi:hypothetical protein